MEGIHKSSLLGLHLFFQLFLRGIIQLLVLDAKVQSECVCVDSRTNGVGSRDDSIDGARLGRICKLQLGSQKDEVGRKIGLEVGQGGLIFLYVA